MIASTFRIGFLTLTGLVLAWTSALLLPSWSEKLLAAELASYAAAFPVAAAPEIEPSSPIQDALPVRLLRDMLGDSGSFQSAALIVNRRLGVSLRVTPFVVIVLGVSLATGLLLRERLRLGHAYASPSISFLAKRLAEGALLVFLVWSFSPVPLPYWGVYPLLGGLAIGGTSYVANLPLRL